MEHVVLQPKYMGSRCNVYLHKDPERCFAVSRNGYKVNHVDLSSVYGKLLHKFGGYIEEYRIAMLPLDGELLPWKVLGEGLIICMMSTCCSRWPRSGRSIRGCKITQSA